MTRQEKKVELKRLADLLPNTPFNEEYAKILTRMNEILDSF